MFVCTYVLLVCAEAPIERSPETPTPRVRNQYFRATGLKESETVRNEGKALRKCDIKLLLNIVIILYNTKLSTFPVIPNSPSN
jgi:hypothetical protein